MGDHDKDITYQLPPELLANSALLQPVVEEEQPTVDEAGEHPEVNSASPALHSATHDTVENEGFVLNIDEQHELTHYQKVKREISLYMRDRQVIVGRCNQKLLESRGSVLPFSLDTSARTNRKPTSFEAVSSVAKRQQTGKHGNPPIVRNYPARHDALNPPRKLTDTNIGIETAPRERNSGVGFVAAGRTDTSTTHNTKGVPDFTLRSTRRNTLLARHRVRTVQDAALTGFSLSASTYDQHPGYTRRKKKNELIPENRKTSLLTPRRQPKERYLPVVSEDARADNTGTM